MVGDKTNPVTFIPFHVMKVNQKWRSDVSPKEYICTEAYDPARGWQEDDYTWEQYTGEVVKCSVNNYKTFIVHGIVPGNDDDDMALPVSITFKSSAGKGIKPITNHFATVAQFNNIRGTDKVPFNFAWDLSSELVKDGGNTFAAWTVAKSRKATDDEIEECKMWAKSLGAKAMEYAAHAGEAENTTEGSAQAPVHVTSSNVSEVSAEDVSF